MIKEEKYVRNQNEGLEYRYTLALVGDEWEFTLECRDIKLADEKKNEKNFGWIYIWKNFPKECEIIFASMKDTIIDRLDNRFRNKMEEWKHYFDE